jgi:LacI family transcriptional regulator
MTQSNRRAGRAATLTDVARIAGVSIATASKAINGRDEVAPSTRKRVIDAAEQLSFTPNALARSLTEGRSGTVGLLTSDLEGRFVLPVLMGAEDAFGAGAINVFLCDARGDSIREQHHLKALLNRRVDGIIVVGRSTDPRPSLGQDLPVPVVYAYAPSNDPRDTSLVPDNRAGGRLAVAASPTSRATPPSPPHGTARSACARAWPTPASSSSATCSSPTGRSTGAAMPRPCC